MTDRPTLPLDEVEDRVRRTFATRADDMTLGDDAGEGLPPVADPVALPLPPHRRWRPLVAVAAAAALVVVLAGGAVLAIRGGGGDGGGDVAAGDAPNPGASTRDLVLAVGDLITALEDERMATLTYGAGLEDVLASTGVDTATARSSTDTAVAAFEVAAAASEDAGIHQEWLDSSVDLDHLRSDADVGLASDDRNLADMDVAVGVSDRYGELVGMLLDAEQTFVLAMDDPDARAAAEMYRLGLGLQVDSRQLGWSVLIAAIAPDPDAIAAVSQWRSSVRQQQADLEALATSTPYEDAVASVVADVSDLLRSTDESVEGGWELAAVADDWQEAHESWSAFLDEVEVVLAET